MESDNSAEAVRLLQTQTGDQRLNRRGVDAAGSSVGCDDQRSPVSASLLVGQDVVGPVPDGALDLSFFPTGRGIAGFWIKAILPSEGQEARQEADQTTVVFGDSGRQVGRL